MNIKDQRLCCIFILPPHSPQYFLQLSFAKEELQSGLAASHHDSLFTQLEVWHSPQYFLQLSFANEVLQSGLAASHHDSLFTQLEVWHNPQYFLQSRFAALVLQSGCAASQYDSLLKHPEDPRRLRNEPAIGL